MEKETTKNFQKNIYIMITYAPYHHNIWTSKSQMAQDLQPQVMSQREQRIQPTKTSSDVS